MPGAKDLSRRRFIRAAAGAAGLAAVGSSLPATLAAAAPGAAVGERLVPPGKLGIQQFSIRDAITRRSSANSLANGLTPTRGYLGGPSFPNDPTDLGPLVDLPGGFAETFEYLASIGYRGFEFFQFSQNVNELGRQPTSAEIRTYLDNAGLASFGTHTGAINTMFDATTGALSAAGQTQVLIAQTLGHTMIGTAGDPTALATLADRLNANGTITPGWTEMARRANALVELLAPLGIRWYWHTEQNGWQFFTDPDLTRTHRIDWWAANTGSAVHFEPDLQHSFAGRARFPDPVGGSRWDALGFWKAHSQRLVGWHIKDGNRLVPPPPLVTTNPFTQVVNRPPTFVAGAGGTAAGADCIYAGEGSIGQGYPVDPDPAVVGYKRIFDEVPAKGSRFFIVESDNAIGNAADPGRSLRHAKYSMRNMLGLRGGYTGRGHSSVPDEAIFESAFEDGVPAAG
jgi:sugar phosphate isomerase/epimerase